MTGAAAVEAAVADVHRREWARVLAATVRVARDLDLAEECVQDAYAAALRAWPAAGVPDHPAAWLTTTARRRAIDAMRHDAALRARLPLLVEPEQEPARPGADADTDAAADLDAARLSEVVPDERLRLIFICCHPALGQQAQVALTLRLVCGMSVPDIARAFLLLTVWPSPVVALNRAVPLAMAVGPREALAEVERLNADGRLSGYQYLHAIRADLLTRLGRSAEAADAYRQALALTSNEAERAFLFAQIKD